MDFKKTLKTIYSYLFNGLALLRMNSVGKRIFIKRHLKVSSAKFISLGDNVRVGIFGRFECYKIENGQTGKIKIGANVSLGDFCTILSGGNVCIGDNTWFASFITILAESHGLNPNVGIYCGQPLYGQDVTIGNSCWLGEKVIVLPGVTIGDWSVIGAGSLVSKDIPPYSIAVGNPAKVIKRYDPTIKRWVRI